MSFWESVKAVFGSSSTDETNRRLREFQERIGYRFKDEQLLKVALTHRSFAKSIGDEWLPSNERLEFLGDSVLGLVVADFLYKKYPDKLEGGLTKRKSLLVNETALFRISSEIDLGNYILLSQEEDKAGGRERSSINADCFEAVIGAMYLDGGLPAVREFIAVNIMSKMDEIAADESFRNYKGDLLEHLQARGEGMPRYEVVSEEGPEHAKIFTVAVYTNGKKIGLGVGTSKKDAEQKAAAEAMLALNVE